MQSQAPARVCKCGAFPIPLCFFKQIYLYLCRAVSLSSCFFITIIIHTEFFNLFIASVSIAVHASSPRQGRGGRRVCAHTIEKKWTVPALPLFARADRLGVAIAQPPAQIVVHVVMHAERLIGEDILCESRFGGDGEGRAEMELNAKQE
jgi:hypothetical protein